MPTVALIGPELYPIPPIRGGAAELFIEKVAARLTGWRPVVIGVSDPELPRQETRGRVEYHRVPLAGWRHWLYCRYRHYFPLYDRQVARLIQQVRPDLIHVHNRPLLALFLERRFGGQIPVILHMHNLYESLGKRERPRPGTVIPVAGFAACSKFRAGAGAVPAGAGRGAAFGSSTTGWSPAPLPRSGTRPPGSRRCAAGMALRVNPTVLFAGKLRESKGVHILLRAMTRVWETVPRAVLVLVGGTEYGRGRTMRETPFMGQLRRDLARAPGPGGAHRVYPAAGDAPGLSPGRRLCGPVPDRGGTRAGFSGGRRRRAAHHRHPPGRHPRSGAGRL